MKEISWAVENFKGNTNLVRYAKRFHQGAKRMRRVDT